MVAYITINLICDRSVQAITIVVNFDNTKIGVSLNALRPFGLLPRAFDLAKLITLESKLGWVKLLCKAIIEILFWWVLCLLLLLFEQSHMGMRMFDFFFVLKLHSMRFLVEIQAFNVIDTSRVAYYWLYQDWLFLCMDDPLWLLVMLFKVDGACKRRLD